MKTHRRFLLIISATTVLACLIGWRLTAPLAPMHGRMLQNPIALQDFALTEADRPFTIQDLKGRWSVLTFGYTHCPDVCPTTLAYFRDELKQLPEDGAVQFVFISIDPARDQAEKLQTYVTHFHPAIRGVTGHHDELTRLTKTLHTRFEKEGDGSDDSYAMAHAPQYFVVSPEGKVVALYSPPLAPGALAEDLRELSRRRGLFL